MDLTLIDSSAWIEWFRGTGSAADQAVKSLRDEPELVAVTPPVRCEVLAGVAAHAVPMVDAVLRSAIQLDVQPWRDFDTAADLYRAARATGNTVRSLIDCLIAAIVIRTGVTVLHRDRDFDVLAGIAPDLRCWSAMN